MKSNTSLMRVLRLAVLIGAAVCLRADVGSPVAAPAAPAAPGAKQVERTIPGIAIPRKGKDGFLGLVLENSCFKLSFYDKDKKPIPADVTRATARWMGHHSIYDERAVLNASSDGMALTSTKFVQGPFTFKVFLTLLTEGNDAASENYVVDFHQ
jgi:hypothetical protein